MKHVMFIVPTIAGIGGSVRVATQLANRLSEQYRVSIVSCSSGVTSVFSLNETIRVDSLDIDTGRVREKVQVARKPLLKLLDDIKPDIVFGIGTYETLMALGPCRKKHIPLIFCDHGALINQWDDKLMRVIRLLDALLSTRTVVLTKRSLNDYHTRLHIPLNKLQCIPNWISHNLLCKERTYDSASCKIIWAGRFHSEKGIDNLLDIAEKVLPSHPDWTWDVYGGPVAEEAIDLDLEIRKRHLEGQLINKGCSDSLYDLYPEYAICTLTSYREGLPLVLLEGKACGLPAISFDINTGPADLIEDGKTGYLVEPFDCDIYADKLGMLMDHPELRQSMFFAQIDSIQEFSEDVIYGKWCTLIKSVC